MKPTEYLAAIGLITLISIVGCAGLHVGQQVQSGRNALQSGRPNDAVVPLAQAAETDPDYEIPYRIHVSVLTYLGRAYYETGKYQEARSVLEKAVGRNKEDRLERVYLGLTLIREREQERGRKEIEAGIKGIHEDLEYIAADNINGIFWDPARSIRSAIETTLATKTDDSILVASAEQIGVSFDEEIDKARRDEGRFRAGRGAGGGS